MIGPGTSTNWTDRRSGPPRLRPVRRAVPIAALTIALLLGPAAGPGQAATRSVPQGFFGVMADGPLLGSGTNLEHEFDTMVGAGVESVRVAFYWSDAQPTPDGPTDYTETDRVVAAAAQRGLSVLPVVIRAPSWAARSPGDVASPPKGTADYARFVAALVRHYGPSGSFWAEHPEVPKAPVRDWQIWNEPNITRYWSQQPFAAGYVKLLRAARSAIKRADPGARIVLCGLANFSWRALRSIYQAGARRSFDVAAVHPFTGKVRNAEKIVKLNRAVMRHYGDARKPMMLTEVTWSSAKGKKVNTFGWETTEAGQAKRVTQALELFAQDRKALGIERVYWYTWLTPDFGSPNSFDWSGLRKLVDGTPTNKPALEAYRKVALALEGCTAKLTATRCG